MRITGDRAGLGSDTLPAAPALYVPLAQEARSAQLGVLAVLPSNPRRVLLPEQRHLLETFAGQIGAGARAGPAGRGGRGRAHVGGERESAQYVARLDLA